MKYIKHMTIVKGITDTYAAELSRNLYNELNRRLEEGTMTVVSADKVSTTYQNLKPSLIERVPDNDYVYIIDTQQNIREYYMIAPDENKEV